MLQGVDCMGPSDCWAVGWLPSGSGLIEHYDGGDWSVVPSPSLLSGASPFLAGVSCSGPYACWAVGELLGVRGGRHRLPADLDCTPDRAVRGRELEHRERSTPRRLGRPVERGDLCQRRGLLGGGRDCRQRWRRGAAHRAVCRRRLERGHWSRTGRWRRPPEQRELHRPGPLLGCGWDRPGPWPPRCGSVRHPESDRGIRRQRLEGRSEPEPAGQRVEPAHRRGVRRRCALLVSRILDPRAPGHRAADRGVHRQRLARRLGSDSARRRGNPAQWRGLRQHR